MTAEKFRLVTRSDFDGLICAVLLKELDVVEDITFVHPKDVQDGVVHITQEDITTNVPYAEDALLVFDHYSSEKLRVPGDPENRVLDANAASAARVVWESFGGKERFSKIPGEIMMAVDKADSAQFTTKDIFEPDGWTLLNFIMDARTGLGRFHDFRISNYQLMMKLIDCVLKYDVSEILELPDVKERVELYFKHQEKFKEQLKKCTKIEKNLAIVDLREEDVIFAGNRFMVYALYPTVNISMHIMWGKNKQNVVFAPGHSILNRTSKTDVGQLMLKYGGGGHKAAGTCQVETGKADEVRKELIETIVSNG